MSLEDFVNICLSVYIYIDGCCLMCFEKLRADLFSIFHANKCLLIMCVIHSGMILPCRTIDPEFDSVYLRSSTGLSHSSMR
jgi:hypothetical protein